MSSDYRDYEDDEDEEVTNPDVVLAIVCFTCIVCMISMIGLFVFYRSKVKRSINRAKRLPIRQLPKLQRAEQTAATTGFDFVGVDIKNPIPVNKESSTVTIL